VFRSDSRFALPALPLQYVVVKLLLTIFGYCVALFAAIGSLSWPLGRDQGIFAWVGEVILGGGLPYRDAWDIKGPLSYYCYALGLAAFGHNDIAIRILDLTIMAAGCWFLRELVLRLTKPSAFGANSAVIFFLLAYYGGGFWNSAQPDAWGGVLVLVVVALLCRSERLSLRSMAAIGGLIAFATLLKPTFMAFIALPVMAVLAFPARRPDAVRSLLACGTGFLCIALASFLALSVGGNLDDLIDVNRFLALSHAGLGKRHIFAESVSLGIPLAKLGLLIPLLLAPVGILSLRLRGMRPQSMVVAMWLILAIALVIIQGKYWLYHWIPAVIAAAVTTGLSLDYLTNRFAGRPAIEYRGAAITLILFMAVIAPVAVRALFHCYTWPSYALGLQNKESYWAQFTTPDGRWKYSDIAKISEFVASNSAPSDKVLIWGWDPLVYILAHRRTPTRFGFSYPLTIPGPLRDEYRSRFLRDIGAAPPTYIIVDARDPWELPARSGLSLLNDFPDFNALIHREYAVASSVSSFQIWKLIAPTP
jgi:hypothetical protein